MYENDIPPKYSHTIQGFTFALLFSILVYFLLGNCSKSTAPENSKKGLPVGKRKYVSPRTFYKTDKTVDQNEKKEYKRQPNFMKRESPTEHDFSHYADPVITDFIKDREVTVNEAKDPNMTTHTKASTNVRKFESPKILEKTEAKPNNRFHQPDNRHNDADSQASNSHVSLVPLNEQGESRRIEWAEALSELNTYQHPQQQFQQQQLQQQQLQQQFQQQQFQQQFQQQSQYSQYQPHHQPSLQQQEYALNNFPHLFLYDQHYQYEQNLLNELLQPENLAKQFQLHFQQLENPRTRYQGQPYQPRQSPQ